tara:strand:+ start:3960 stop:4109 length:150 start_codon:yes stop_codon:yes gene_type:complete
MFEVHIVETETGKIESIMPATSMHTAEKIERGANINLNHSKYHTDIIEK